MNGVKSGLCGPAREFQTLGQFQPRHVLKHFQHDSRISLTVFDLLITMAARLQGQVIGLNGIPEARIIHRLQPFFNIFDVLKNRHGRRLSDNGRIMQTTRAKAGSL